MYTSFFGLNEKPFSITPDPRYLFMSERHTEALAHLIYGVRESGGFIQLTGEVGTGKTTLVRSLLQQLPENADVAVILNPQLSRNEFLSAICEELGVALPESTESIKALINVLNAYLLRNHSRGRHTILIVDEAQNLQVDVLEQVRLLTNLETSKKKLLQIILIAQPELRESLSRNDMRQLAQRITGRYHLQPLNRDETIAYIDHRLKVAGGLSTIFSNGAKRELYRLAQGVPRMINVIADRSLLGAFTSDDRQVTPALVRSAASEVFDQRVTTFAPWYRWLRAVATVFAVVVVAAVVGLASARWLRVPADLPKIAAQVSEPPPIVNSLPAVSLAREPVTISVPEDKLELVLKGNGDATTTDHAFQALLALWGAEYSRGTTGACEQAERYSLHCMFQRGSLSQVRSLDRPVILTLRDRQSRQHQVVLSGLNDEVAAINIGEKEYQVSVADLANFWFGEYLLLWQPQIGEVKAFYPGMRDQHIKWLRESLAEIQGEPIRPMESDFYDGDLELRVRDYQRERRLNVDGLVGKQTQISINTDLGAADRPRLVRAN